MQIKAFGIWKLNGWIIKHIKTYLKRVDVRKFYDNEKKRGLMNIEMMVK